MQGIPVDRWDGNRRVHGTVIHIDIIEGKVWIQHNGTPRRIGEEMVAAGIPREAIVLGFQPPHARKYTGFGVGEEIEANAAAIG